VLPTALALALSLSACGGDGDEPAATEPTTSAPAGAKTSSTPSASASAAPSLPPDDDRFGSGCRALSSWRGNPDRRTEDIPAVLALLNLPEVSDSYGLLGNNRLARERGVTFFLPVNNAYTLLSFEFLYQLLRGDPVFQRSVVRHLVVKGRLAPSELVGEHETYAGDTMAVTTEGDQFRIDDDGALVECGNLRTLDATIYLIDRLPRP